MTLWRRIIALSLSLSHLISFAPAAQACGPEYVAPIFVFTESPDPPFVDYAAGKIGIVQPSNGQKTLFIAYRYLSGGSFTSGEQQALIEALNGKAPESDDATAVKAWIAARSEIGLKEEKPPEIYTERQYGGYDFFPNCAKNAFEVATETLKERAARYGPEDKNVRAWLAAQDTVFQNCNGTAQVLAEVGQESPAWLRKDRDYQIAAAHFYSLNFAEARRRFEAIARDNESDWQLTADYLVARTLVRQASLEGEAKTREIYDRTELHLQKLISSGGKFANASRSLLALLKYRVHPEQRIRELAQALAAQNANDNLRQDLIDYVWLLAKFEAQTLKEEEQRKDALKPIEPKPEAPVESKETREINEAFQRKELFEVMTYPTGADGQPDYRNLTKVIFKSDASENDVLRTFEEKLGRKLTAEETEQVKHQYDLEIAQRKTLMSPNYKLGSVEWARYEGCNFECDRMPLDLIPEFLRADDLNDWIFTFRTEDPHAYSHAFDKWRETDSAHWLAATIAKADAASPDLDRVLKEAGRIQRDSPAFPTIAYHLVRLKIAFGKTDEARKLLDEIISWQADFLPISAQNQFVEQRFQLAANLKEFLKFGARKPAAFSDYGRYGKMSDLFEIGKRQWEPDTFAESKEKYAELLEAKYEKLLPWDERVTFDEQTVDFFNWHFSLEALAAAAHDPAVPDYLQRRLILAAWTRAVLLKNDVVAQRIAPDVMKAAPEMSAVFNLYLKARTTPEKENSALYVLLKFPDLSPLVAAGVPTFETAEAADYYFETSWWCTPSATEYDPEGKEVPKVVTKPGFINSGQSQAALRERTALVAIGNAKSYLGKQVLRWATSRPEDPRIPEALYIAVRANESYKYGCDSWEADPKTMEKAANLLRTRYPHSPWTAKLSSAANADN